MDEEKNGQFMGASIVSSGEHFVVRGGGEGREGGCEQGGEGVSRRRGEGREGGRMRRRGEGGCEEEEERGVG